MNSASCSVDLFDQSSRIAFGHSREFIELLKEVEFLAPQHAIRLDDFLKGLAKPSEFIGIYIQGREHMPAQRPLLRSHRSHGLCQSVGFFDRQWNIQTTPFVQVFSLALGPDQDPIHFIPMEMAVGLPASDENCQPRADNVPKIAAILLPRVFEAAPIVVGLARLGGWRGLAGAWSKVKAHCLGEKTGAIEHFAIGGDDRANAVNTEVSNGPPHVTDGKDSGYAKPAGETDHGDLSPSEASVRVFVLDRAEQVFERLVFVGYFDDQRLGGVFCGWRCRGAIPSQRRQRLNRVFNPRRASKQPTQQSHSRFLRRVDAAGSCSTGRIRAICIEKGAA